MTGFDAPLQFPLTYEGHQTISPSKRGGEGEASLSLPDFLRTLFRLLDESEIRYCVLHSWERLPKELTNDLDLGVHINDKLKLLSVFAGLRRKGYSPVQCLNHSENGNFFVFFWAEVSKVRTAAVDIVFEHRRGGLTLASGEQMVADRQWHGEFWTSSPKVEFAYLLAKKSYKGRASPSQSLRLKVLAEQLGPAEAEKIAHAFLPGDWNRRSVESCLDGSLAEILAGGRARLWRVSWSRHPLRLFRYLAGEYWRMLRRCFQRTGLVVAIMGPDGVGKSTVITGLVKTLDIAFWRRHRLFHWRPNVVARKRSTGPATDPHGQSARGTVRSMFYLFVFLLDYWVGYLFLIRPLLARSNFVLFDRYFHDVLVDPRRYRYGGPKWFAEMLCRLVPEPDMVILLDADDGLIVERKSELSRDEIQRQRETYRKLRFNRSQGAFVTTDGGIELALRESSSAVAEFMKQRFDKRFRGWLSVSTLAIPFE